MVINSLNLKHFGKFQEEKIELHDKVNVIYGENEAGKSTIHSFIKGMLFGIDKQRGRTNLDQYTKYQPWETPTLYNGEMEVTIDDTTYLIKRNFYKEERSLNIINKETGREVPYKEQKGHCFIEGLTESNYTNTVYIGQGQVATNKELAFRINDYITNMSTTQSSEVNVAEALKELQARKKEIDGKQTKQKIKELNTELQKIQNTDFMLKEIERQIVSLDKEIEDFTKAKLECKVDPMLLQKLQVLDSYVKEHELIKEKYQNLMDLRAYYKQLMQQIYVIKQSTHGEDHDKQQERKANETIKIEDKKEAYDLKNTRRFRCFVSKLALILFTLIGCASFFILDQNTILKYSIFLICLMSICIIFIKQQIDKRKRENDTGINIGPSKEQPGKAITTDFDVDGKNEEKLRNLLFEYEETSSKLLNRMHKQEDEILIYANKVISIDTVNEDSMQHLQNEVDKIALQINKHKDSIQQKQESEKQIISQIDIANAKKEKLRWEYTKLDESIADHAKKRAIRDDLLVRLDREEVELTAIEISIQMIQELATTIHDDFGQKLNHEVSRITNIFTNGSCYDIKVDENLKMKVVKEQEYVMMNYLSTGTMEQLYLALRLVAADLLFKDKNMPLILDDAFAYYDEARLTDTLCELTQNTDRQILIFTCHKRESQILDKYEIPYHYITCGMDIE